MTSPKNQVDPVEADEIPVADEPLELEEAPLADAPDAPVAAEGPVAAPGKKPVGVKEVIPFAWKLIGQANGLFLTLFKSVEREDCDAQLDRVKRDGYYTNLRVAPLNEKVEQPKPAKSAKKGDPSHAKEVQKTLGTRTVAKEPAAAKESKPSSKAAKEARESSRPPQRILVAGKPAVAKSAGKSSKPTKSTAGGKSAAAKASADAKVVSTKSGRSARSTKSAEPPSKKKATAKSATKKPAKSRK